MLEWSVPLWADFALLAVAAAVIGVAGVKASGFADRLADRTGLGEAVTGTIFLGLMTALPGLIASIVAALKGQPSLAVHNAIGGIAVQTVALAVADLAYRKANLEHAAASVPNIMQSVILVVLLTLVLLGLTGPDVTVGHVHPATLILFFVGGCAFWLVWKTRDEPMWEPKQTQETVEDVPDEGHEQENLTWLVAGLLVAGAVMGVAGATVAESATNIVEETDLPEAVVGGLFMAIATSLPEFVTSIAAVRRGALTLAVSDIVGGNFFDVLFVAAADLVYLSGSLYHGDRVGSDDYFLTAVTILLNAILLLGLIYRQKRGPANIGFESVAMFIVYLGGLLTVTLLM